MDATRPSNGRSLQRCGMELEEGDDKERVVEGAAEDER